MKVKFVPQDVEFEIQPGQSVMGLAHEKGIVIRSTCNGLPSCAECRVRVVDGDYNCSPPSRKELSLIGTGYYIDQRRLSCQVICFGDITVDTQEQIEKGSEGPVTKKFLTKVHKTSASESHSLGGVLIEQDEKLLAEIQKEGPTQSQPQARREGAPRQQRQGPRPGGGGGGSATPQGGGGGGQKRRRRGRGGRGRGGGGGGGNAGGSGPPTPAG